MRSFAKPTVYFLVLIMLAGIMSPVFADSKAQEIKKESSDSRPFGCPNANIFENIVDGMCWSCSLPISIFGGAVGIDFGKGKKKKDGSGSERPSGASKSPGGFCLNKDNNGVPHPTYGATVSMWAPAKLAEVTNVPWCFPSLGGIDFNDSDASGLADASENGELTQGSGGIAGIRGIADSFMVGGNKTSTADGEDGGNSKQSFYHSHLIEFPLFAILNAIPDTKCLQDKYFDVDVTFMSEVNVAYNDTLTSAMLSPEGAAFSSLPAISACSIDAVASTTADSIDRLYWCAGSWGEVFPLNGYHRQEHSFVETTSLASYKLLMTMHRLGLVRESYGSNEAMCGKPKRQWIPKKQGWRHSMIFPVAESENPCCHNIGANTFKWGEHRQYPGEGTQAAVYMYNKFTECLATY